ISDSAGEEQFFLERSLRRSIERTGKANGVPQGGQKIGNPATLSRATSYGQTTFERRRCRSQKLPRFSSIVPRFSAVNKGFWTETGPSDHVGPEQKRQPIRRLQLAVLPATGWPGVNPARTLMAPKCPSSCQRSPGEHHGSSRLQSLERRQRGSGAR